MAARVSAAAITGSHQAVAPMAMRPGMALGAVSGKYDSAQAAALLGCPIVMNEAK